MPLRYFICPDKQKIEVKDCLKEGGCRMGNRCATRSYLQLVAKERPWTGRPSTTQLIQGTLQAFFKLTKEYAISPDARAFMIHGTKSHTNLESSEDEFSLLEEKFDGPDVDITGISDVLEEELKKSILADYKTSGSFKVAKALGFVTIDEDIPGEVFKSGPRKGQPKKRKILIRDLAKVDMWEWELQLNKYRIEFEKKGKKVDEMKIQCCVRDGNTYIARSRGVFRNIYYFKVKRLEDNYVLAYFKKKKEALLQALKQGHWEETCTAKESWDGLKCARYCEVSEFCPYGKFLTQEKEVSDMPIKNLSEIRRLPRLGKIRLGIKVRNDAGVEYPKEVDYLILDPQTPSELENKKLIEEFHRLYGDKPKQIKIMFPVSNPDVYFPQYYKRYGKSTSLQCKGDGDVAFCGAEEFTKDLEKLPLNKEEMGIKVKCLGKECSYYKNNQCSEVGILQVLLPDMPGAGVWQIATGSFNSIVNLNSCIAYIGQVCGRAHMIPLMLERRPQEIQYEGKKRTHHILNINMDFRLSDLQKLANVDPTKILLELPPPETDKEDILFEENKIIDVPAKKGKTQEELGKELEAEDKKNVEEAKEEGPTGPPDMIPATKKQIDKIKKIFRDKTFLIDDVKSTLVDYGVQLQKDANKMFEQLSSATAEKILKAFGPKE